MAESNLNKEYERVFGEDFTVNESVSSPKKSTNRLFKLMTVFFSIFVGPNRNMSLEWSEVGYKSIGLLMLLSHLMIFVFFNTVIDTIEGFGLGKGMTIGIKGLVFMYALYQVFRGMLIFNGQGYMIDKVAVQNEATRYKQGHRSGSGNVSMGAPRFGNFSKNDEIQSTIGYMNSKMSGMSNAKKESYLRDFHGGGK